MGLLPWLLVLSLQMGATLFFEERDPIRDRDLIIVRVNFGESQKAVAIAAIVDEGRLKRRLHARHFREVNIASQRFLIGGLEIEFLDFITAQHHNPGFFRVGGVDQHFVGHE